MFKSGELQTRTGVSRSLGVVRGHKSFYFFSISYKPSIRRCKKAFTLPEVLLAAAILAMALILVAHNILTRSIEELVSQPSITKKNNTPQQTAEITPNVTRRSFLEPDRKFIINSVFKNGEKIAEFKSRDDMILEISGKIPDGRVDFENLSMPSRGHEHYKDGLRHGEYKEYHPNGKIWFDKYYKNGKIIDIKEYFNDGNIRMKADYSDALQICETKDNGTGIVYRKNGKPMYEWHLTRQDNNRFKKFYDAEGQLQKTQYFDINGRPIETKNAAQAAKDM